MCIRDRLHEETPLTISRRAFLEGARDTAANTSLMGRWQKLGEQPLTVCDTCLLYTSRCV